MPETNRLCAVDSTSNGTSSYRIRWPREEGWSPGPFGGSPRRLRERPAAAARGAAGCGRPRFDSPPGSARSRNSSRSRMSRARRRARPPIFPGTAVERSIGPLMWQEARAFGSFDRRGSRGRSVSVGLLRRTGSHPAAPDGAARTLFTFRPRRIAGHRVQCERSGTDRRRRFVRPSGLVRASRPGVRFATA